MGIKFNQIVKHGGHTLLPDVAYGFEDPHAESYFNAMGWSATTGDDPVYTFTADELSVDPDTVHGSGELKGSRVLPLEE